MRDLFFSIKVHRRLAANARANVITRFTSRADLPPSSGRVRAGLACGVEVVPDRAFQPGKRAVVRTGARPCTGPDGWRGARPAAASALAPARRYRGPCPKGGPAMLLTLQTSPPIVTT